MTTTANTAPTATVPSIPIDRIRVDWTLNTRDRDDQQIAAYAESIKLVGVKTPVSVIPIADDDAFDVELVAGFHRYEAARIAGETELPYTLGDAAASAEAHAIENIARAQAWPLEEALSIERLYAQGYTAQGAAEILTKTVQWVTMREPLLALRPELRRPWSIDSSRTVLGGHPKLSVAKALKVLDDVAPWAAQALVDLAMLPEPTDAWPAPQRPLLSLDSEQLGTDAKSAIVALAPKGHFAAAVELGSSRLRADDIAKVPPIKRGHALADRLTAAEAAWTKVSGQYDYFPGAKFSREDVDTLRAVGVLFICSDDADFWFAAVCFDRDAWLDAVEAAVARVEQTIEAHREKRRAASAAGKKDQDLTPKQRAERELRQVQRLMAGPDSPARAANHDLYSAMYAGDSLVDAAVHLDVARLFVEHWLGGRGLMFTDDGRLLASNNWNVANVESRKVLMERVRLAVPELSRIEAPISEKTGKEGKPKVVYATDAETWAWILRYLDGAKTSAEVFDRAIKLMIFGQHTIAHAASVGRSKHPSPIRLGSPEAQKALDRVVKGRMPKTLAKVKGALTRAYKAAGTGLDSRI